MISKGVVKWYDETKGYGFIVSEFGDEIFVHRSGLANPMSKLREGEKVVFELKQGDKGLIAVDVKHA